MANLKSPSPKTNATPQKKPFSCAHCQSACPNDLIKENEKVFCCHGCLAVYQALHTPIDDSPPRVAHAHYASLSDPDVRAHLLSFSDGKTARVTFRIPGIHCASCVQRLEKLYTLHPGVGHSEVNFGRKEVTITYHENKMNLVELATLLDQNGFPPELHLDALHGKKTTNLHRSFIIKLGIAGFAFGNIMLLSFPSYLGLKTGSDIFAILFPLISLLLALPVFFYSAADYWRGAWSGLKQHQLTIDVPIVLGLIALMGQSIYDLATQTGEGYLDSLAGLIFLLLCGKWFQRKSFDALSFERDYKAYFPLTAERITNDQEEVVSLSKLTIGDIVRIRHGEMIPADATLIKGEAILDYSFVTGESHPVNTPLGDLLHAGGRQCGTAIQAKIIRPVSQSYLTSLWDSEIFRKQATGFDNITNKVSNTFTPIIMILAISVGLIWLKIDPSRALHAFTAILIVACPCALALSAPFTFGSMMRIFGRNKLFLKNAGVIERLAKLNHLVFDKTGTLTLGGQPKVAYEGTPLTPHQEASLRLLTSQSNHPLSRMITAFLPPHKENLPLSHFQEHTGKGLEAHIDAQHILLGSPTWFQEKNLIEHINYTESSSNVLIAIHQKVIGRFILTHAWRDAARPVINQLETSYHLEVLTGDQSSADASFRKWFGPDIHIAYEQSPHQKMHAIENLQQQGQHVMMIGDGLNDAGALAQSDVGLAITEDLHAFSPACDAILDASVFDQLPRFLKLAKGAVTIVIISFILSLMYNIIGIAFAATGKLSPLIAAILMPLSSMTIIAFTTLTTHTLNRFTIKQP